ncbi:enoyl-CoA hydratase-related protein [Tianweitania sediminis]|uniref:Enoyl-CoA hydratase/isomerase family protein n=1 Tax=Tianweitania sediminis TaxID=1502156 RepID=A0A8J7UKY1_9HYPH|nr:enoyl-CoA hydratase-related protein [Tianweitania sediminis]MBP0440340.1 enoyl-CoA hydratase/isomerase family protein [Tianweitania sediminis]
MANVLVERAGTDVVLLRLNRPEARNALSPELREELRDLFLALDRDESCRAIVITGDMRAFAAGADIKAMAEATPAEMMERDDETNWAAIRNCRKPVIAAVNGYALGGGCELAMHCDIIIAGKSARFGQPEVKLGIMPGAGGTQRLTRAIGKFRAMQLLLTGDFLSAEEAHVAGLVSSVSEDDAVVGDALALAARIAALPPLAVEEIKRVVLTGMDMPLEAALKLEMRSAYLLFGTADKGEAMRAFVEKRPAVFTGK